MMQRAVFVLTTDLNIMSMIGALPTSSSVRLRSVPTASMLLEVVSECLIDDLCVIIDDEDADVRSFLDYVQSKRPTLSLIALADHPYPDIVQRLRLQGIQHVVKRDVLPELLASITKDLT